MSKSCWQPSHFHMAVFPPRAARLWRMETHAWAVISHAGVSSGSLVLPCCSVMPQLGAGIHWCWGTKWSHISPFCKLWLTRAHWNQKETHSLPRDGTAQLRSTQCIGTRSHSSSHTHPPLSPSLSRSLLPPLLMPTLLLLLLLLRYFLPSSLCVSEEIHSSALGLCYKLEETRDGSTIPPLHSRKEFPGCLVRLCGSVKQQRVRIRGGRGSNVLSGASEFFLFTSWP